MNMSAADKKILLKFLNDLSDRYGNDGCNDYTLPSNLSAEEIKVLRGDVLEFVQSKPDFEEDAPNDAVKSVLGTNWLMVCYLIDKIEKS